MNFPIYIARRYLFSKKSRNAINIISFVSVAGIAVGTAALIIILSVFNGFDSLLRKLYNSFDPDVKIVAVNGKGFVADSVVTAALQSDDITAYSLCLEENAMLEYNDKQIVATIKGVDDNFDRVTGIDTMVVGGDYRLSNYDAPCAVTGFILARDLQVPAYADYAYPLKIYIPNRLREFKGNLQDVSANINCKTVYPAGIFAVHQDYDAKYCIVPLNIAQELLEQPNHVSSVEIKLKDEASSQRCIDELRHNLPNSLRILDRNGQHEYAYKVMQSEKWAIFMILAFILMIASFNIIGSLTMLIIEKKGDIVTLKSLGASNDTVRRIFFVEGLFICLIGIAAGIVVGIATCWLQMEFGLIKLGTAGTFIIDSYPVEIQAFDLIFVIAVVMFISIIAASCPVRYLTRKFGRL